MKRFLTVLTMIVAPALAQADEIINSDVQKAFEETNLSMQKSMEKMDKSMQKIMPQIADSMSQVMDELMQSLPPLMSAIERNKVLSKASEELNRQFQENLKTVSKNFEADLNASSAIAIDDFEMSGSRTVNGNKIDYDISQNKEEAQKVAKIIDAKISNSNSQDDIQIADLKKYNISARYFKLDSLGGNVFLVYSPTPEQAFITGNINNSINIKIQTEGKDALKQAKEFAAAFRDKYLK